MTRTDWFFLTVILLLTAALVWFVTQGPLGMER
jgi:hypothetical protein